MQPGPQLRVAAFYVALRVAIAYAAGPHGHPDTVGYLGHPVNFVGGERRPWVPALPMHVLGAHGYIVFQAALSAVAFCVLAVAVASIFNDRRVKSIAAVLVLLLGLAPRTTAWDAMLLSESLAISFTAVLIACFIWLRRVPWWAYALVFTLWVLTREAHLYLGVLVLVGVAAWGWRERRGVFAVVTAVVLVWGYATYGNDKWVERFNVTVNIAFYAGQDVETFRWFLDEGMPPSDAFFIREYEHRYAALFDDSEFQEWVARDGEHTYAMYLATHPRFLLSGPLTALLTNQAYGGESLVDHSSYEMAHTLGVSAVWPERATTFTVVLLIVTGVLSLVVLRRHRMERRWVLPTALLASTIPHALLAYHAVPSEVARHGAVLAFVLVLGCWWLILLSADVLVIRPQQPELDDERGGDLVPVRVAARR